MNGTQNINKVGGAERKEYSPLSPMSVWGIINALFKSKLIDPDTIDATRIWENIEHELQPDLGYITETLHLRYAEGMTLRAAGKKLNISGNRVREQCMKALHHLRHPSRVDRIKHSIMGWPNIYRCCLTARKKLRKICYLMVGEKV